MIDYAYFNYFSLVVYARRWTVVARKVHRTLLFIYLPRRDGRLSCYLLWANKMMHIKRHKL